MGIISGIFALIFWIIGTIIVLACAVWAWSDGNQRGKPGWLVGLLVFFTFPFGLIAWIIFRPDETDTFDRR